jgi:hypothetical protein
MDKVYSNFLGTSNFPKMYYLASPYSHPDPQVREERYLSVMKRSAELLNQNVYVFSPILYSHEMSKLYQMPTDAAWWWDFNRTIMDKCDGLILHAIPGWKESVGVAQEMQYAKDINLQITFMGVE